MTAPDPRVGEIENRLSAATPAPWEIIGGNEYLTGVDVGIGSAEEGGIRLRDAEFIANAPADVSYLLAELRKAHKALARVEGFLDNDEEKLYAAICLNTCGKDIYGVDHEAIATTIAADLRAAVAAANGDGNG